MSVYLRRNRTLTEDNVEQTTGGNQNASTQQAAAKEQTITAIKQKIVSCENAKALAQKRCNDEVEKQDLNIVQLKQQLAKLGADADDLITKNESLEQNYRFSKKLYEAVQTGKTDELTAAIGETFDNLPNISYYMDEKGCTTLAKRMLTFLNDQSWNDGENHWDEVAEFLTNTLSKANISLSSREMGEFISEFGNVLKTKTMFSWIFGRSAVEKNPVDGTPTEDIQNIDTKEDNLNTEQESLYDPYDDPYEDLDYLPYEL